MVPCQTMPQFPNVWGHALYTAYKNLMCMCVCVVLGARQKAVTSYRSRRWRQTQGFPLPRVAPNLLPWKRNLVSQTVHWHTRTHMQTVRALQCTEKEMPLHTTWDVYIWPLLPLFHILIHANMHQPPSPPAFSNKQHTHTCMNAYSVYRNRHVQTNTTGC